MSRQSYVWRGSVVERISGKGSLYVAYHSELADSMDCLKNIFSFYIMRLELIVKLQSGSHSHEYILCIRVRVCCCIKYIDSGWCATV